ncbi:MAG: hypothetical protein ACK40O_01020 [Allosphingosinicella sp.]
MTCIRRGSVIVCGRIGPKVTHVRRSGQTRKHHCHWPGCDRQVPPAKWGCRQHWFKLPPNLRERIWQAYQIGQEESGRPSAAYVAVAREAQEWIAEHLKREAEPKRTWRQGELFG